MVTLTNLSHQHICFNVIAYCQMSTKTIYAARKQSLFLFKVILIRRRLKYKYDNSTKLTYGTRCFRLFIFKLPHFLSRFNVCCRWRTSAWRHQPCTRQPLHGFQWIRCQLCSARGPYEYRHWLESHWSRHVGKPINVLPSGKHPRPKLYRYYQLSIEIFHRYHQNCNRKRWL